MKTINKKNNIYTSRVKVILGAIESYVSVMVGHLVVHLSNKLERNGYDFDIELIDQRKRPFYVTEKEYKAIRKSYEAKKKPCHVGFDVLEKWYRKEFKYNLKSRLEGIIEDLKESVSDILEGMEGSEKHLKINPETIDYNSFLLGLYDDVIVTYNQERKSNKLKEISKENEILKRAFVIFIEDNINEIANDIVGIS